jgi:hypothetical protein
LRLHPQPAKGVVAGTRTSAQPTSPSKMVGKHLIEAEIREP